MNVAEFLRWTEDYAKEGEVASPARTIKLIALVRKLREQRDGAVMRSKDAAFRGREIVDEDNAALDEIVRGG